MIRAGLVENKDFKVIKSLPHPSKPKRTVYLGKKIWDDPKKRVAAIAYFKKRGVEALPVKVSTASDDQWVGCGTEYGMGCGDGLNREERRGMEAAIRKAVGDVTVERIARSQPNAPFRRDRFMAGRGTGKTLMTEEMLKCAGYEAVLIGLDEAAEICRHEELVRDEKASGRFRAWNPPLEPDQE